MKRKFILIGIISSSFLVGSCSLIADQQELDVFQTDSVSFVGMGSPIDLPPKDSYVDALVGFSPEGRSKILATTPVIFANTLVKVEDGIALATEAGIEVYDSSGSFKKRYATGISGMLGGATSSADYSHASFAFNTSNEEDQEKHTILTFSSEDQHLADSNSFPMGLTTCNDGRVLWLDTEGEIPSVTGEDIVDERGAVLARMNLDGTVSRELLSPDIPLAGGDAVIDCDSESASFTVFDEKQNVQLVVVKNAFSPEVDISQRELDPPPPISTLLNYSGTYDGTYYALLDDGSISTRSGFEQPEMTLEKIDLGEDKPLFATFSGAFVTIVHYPLGNDYDVRATVFSLKNLSCHSETQSLGFWAEGETKVLSESIGTNLYLSSVLPVKEPQHC